MRPVLDELNRRGVLRAAAAYVAIAWGATEILAFLVEAFWGDDVEAIASRYMAIGFVAGFPVAMYLAWTRDLGLRARRIVGASALAGVLLGALLWFGPSGDQPARPPPVSRSGLGSVAVLPLENLSSDPEQEYFAAGMTDALIGVMSRVPDLKVISRTSVARYKGSTKTLPEIAGELGVDAVIEGSVLRDGNRVRITSTLVEAATDRSLWSESFERDMTDVLTLQLELAREIAREVGASLGAEYLRTQTAREVRPEAYDAYLRARTSDLQAATDPAAVVREYEHAIELDPGFAPAHAALADFLSYMALVSNVPAGDAYLRAHQLAERAVELDPALPEARVALARVHFQYEWDWTSAETQLEQALQLDPNNVAALSIFGAYRILVYGDCEHGLSSMEAARQRDPFSPSANFDLGAYAFHCRRWEDSIAHLSRAGQLEPGFHLPRLMLAWNALETGRSDEAVAGCDAVVTEVKPAFDPIVLSSCAWLNAKAGRRETAQHLLEQLRLPPPGVRVDPSWLAGPCAALGDADCAVRALEEAQRQRSSNMMFLRVAVQWDDLRGDPRFQAVLDRMKFPP